MITKPGQVNVIYELDAYEAVAAAKGKPVQVFAQLIGDRTWISLSEAKPAQNTPDPRTYCATYNPAPAEVAK